MKSPFLDQLDVAVRQLVAQEAIDFSGEWSKSLRRAYQSGAQLGSGSGPFVEIVDLRWHGAVTAAEPIGGIAFLHTARNLYWAKTPEISPALSVGVSLHAYAEYMLDRATFAARLGGAYLPGVPVPVGSNLEAVCTIGGGAMTTGRVASLAEAGSASFFVLLLPRRVLKMGRKRLWHVRDDVASILPAGVRELLTRRRSGDIPSQPVQNGAGD